MHNTENENAKKEIQQQGELLGHIFGGAAGTVTGAATGVGAFAAVKAMAIIGLATTGPIGVGLGVGLGLGTAIGIGVSWTCRYMTSLSIKRSEILGIEKFNSAIEKVAQSESELKSSVEALEKQLDNSNASYQNLQTKHTDLSKMHKETKQLLDKKNEEIELYRQEIISLSTVIDACRKTDLEKSSEISKVKAKRDELVACVKQLKDEVSHLNASNNQFAVRIEELTLALQNPSTKGATTQNPSAYRAAGAAETQQHNTMSTKVLKH